MKSFMKTIISAIKYWVDSKVDDISKKVEIQSDWEQNDSTASDYVKNRPFYEVTEDVVVVPEQTITVENGWVQFERNEVENMWNTGIEYTVIFDGIPYTGTTYEDGADMCIRTDFVTNDGYEVYVSDYCSLHASGMTGDHTIQIIFNNVSHTVKLNKKFLPNDAVLSVNGQTGYVYLRASDVGAVDTTQLNTKMDKSNPVGTGSFSMNRRSGTVGDYSHTEGRESIASGDCSHAEGYYTTASGKYSHTEGHNTQAHGDCSHAEGDDTRAHCRCSHVQGSYNIYESNRYMLKKWTTGLITFERSCFYGDGYEIDKNGDVSLINTKTYSTAQETVGKWCLELIAGKNTLCKVISVLSDNRTTKVDKYTTTKETYAYAHIVGNGDVNGRSNAHTLSWDGIGWFQGGLQVGGNAQDDGAQTVMLNGDKEIILKSSTLGSTKQFRITVDDSGTLSAVEVAE